MRMPALIAPSALAFVLILAPLLACHQTIIRPLQAPRNGLNRADLTATARGYAFGIIEGTSPRRAECRDGIESIILSKGLVDSTIHLLIGEFYTTETVDVRCARPHLNIAALQGYKVHTLHGIYFDSGSSVIQGDSNLILDELIAFLKYNSDMRIRLTGHTDLIGSAAGNERLSLQRAEAAKNYLVEHGIEASRISTEGRGARNPAVQAVDEDSSAINRRIEIASIKPAKPEPRKPEVETSEPKKLEPTQPEPIQPKAEQPTEKPTEVATTTITLTDGTVLQGTITDQSADRVILTVNGQRTILLKNRIRKIQYGKH